MMNALIKEQGVWMSLFVDFPNRRFIRIQEEKAHSLVSLSLSNEVRYEVVSEETTYRL